MGVGNSSLKKGRQRIYWWVKEGAAVLNHKPTKVLQLSTNNPVASHKLNMWSMHQKLAAG